MRRRTGVAMQACLQMDAPGRMHRADARQRCLNTWRGIIEPSVKVDIQSESEGYLPKRQEIKLAHGVMQQKGGRYNGIYTDHSYSYGADQD